MRAIFERAMTAVGVHVTKGQVLWEAYREFENAIYSTLQVCFHICIVCLHSCVCKPLHAAENF